MHKFYAKHLPMAVRRETVIGTAKTARNLPILKNSKIRQITAKMIQKNTIILLKSPLTNGRFLCIMILSKTHSEKGG